jgi:hypothetical protein
MSNDIDDQKEAEKKAASSSSSTTKSAEVPKIVVSEAQGGSDATSSGATSSGEVANTASPRRRRSKKKSFTSSTVCERDIIPSQCLCYLLTPDLWCVFVAVIGRRWFVETRHGSQSSLTSLVEEVECMCFCLRCSAVDLLCVFVM